MAKATEMAHQPKPGEAEKDVANLERSLCLYFQFLHEAADLIDQLVGEARQHVKYIDSKIDHLRICNRVELEGLPTATYPDVSVLACKLQTRIQEMVTSRVERIRVIVGRLKGEVLDKAEELLACHAKGNVKVEIQETSHQTRRLLRCQVESLTVLRDLWKGAALGLDVFEDEVKSGSVGVKPGGDEEDCDESDVIFGHQVSPLDASLSTRGNNGQKRLGEVVVAPQELQNACSYPSTRALWDGFSSWKSDSLADALFWSSHFKGAAKQVNKDAQDIAATKIQSNIRVNQSARI